MLKRVLVIASGNTERLALPHLTARLRDYGIAVDVSIPPKHRAITAREAYRIIESERYNLPAPDKYVILVDADGKLPETVLQPIQSGLSQRLGEHFEAAVLYAYAQWHLEAWFFADDRNLRAYLGGRALGGVDTTQPDRIRNPKEHLKNLLSGRAYASRIAGQIASALEPDTIAQRSPSFAGFLSAVRNGAGDRNRASA